MGFFLEKQSKGKGEAAEKKKEKKAKKGKGKEKAKEEADGLEEDELQVNGYIGGMYMIYCVVSDASSMINYVHCFGYNCYILLH